jgi:hypothetical protein
LHRRHIHYLNSGDWVESLTAIVEHYDGRYELVEFSKFIQDYPMTTTSKVASTPELVELADYIEA